MARTAWSLENHRWEAAETLPADSWALLLMDAYGRLCLLTLELLALEVAYMAECSGKLHM